MRVLEAKGFDTLSDTRPDKNLTVMVKQITYLSHSERAEWVQSEKSANSPKKQFTYSSSETHAWNDYGRFYRRNSCEKNVFQTLMRSGVMKPGNNEYICQIASVTNQL